MRSSWHGRLPVNEKKIRVHPLCSVDRETVSTLEACASRNGLRVSAVKFSWLRLRCYVVLCQKSLVGGKEFFDRSKTLRDSSRLRVFVVDWAGPLPRRREDAKNRQVFGCGSAALWNSRFRKRATNSTNLHSPPGLVGVIGASRPFAEAFLWVVQRKLRDVKSVSRA